MADLIAAQKQKTVEEITFEQQSGMLSKDDHAESFAAKEKRTRKILAALVAGFTIVVGVS